jgi:Cu/Ag efflux pump CusA
VGEVIPAGQRTLLLSVVGVGPDWSAVATPNAGPQDATLRVLLPEGQQGRAAGYARRLRHRLEGDPRFKDLQFFLERGDPAAAPLVDGVCCAVNVRLPAPSLGQGLEEAREVRRRLAGVRGAVDVQVVERLDAPYWAVEVDREKAAAVGLSAADVLAQAAAALGGTGGLSRNFWIDAPAGRTHSLAVPLAARRGAGLEDALDVPAAGTPGTRPVQLGSLVRVRRTTAAVEIHHADGGRVFNVRVNAEGRDRAGLLADVKKALEGLRLPPGLRLEIQAGRGP